MGEASVNGGVVKAELRKNLLQAVAHICNKVEDKIYTEQFQVALTNSSLELLEHMISKLTDISSHANSKKIRIADILLYFRSRPVMLSILKDLLNDQDSDDDANSNILYDREEDSD